MSGDQNARRSHNITIDNSSLKGWKVSNNWEQPYQIKILFSQKLRVDFKSGNACYHSVQNVLSSSFLSNNKKIKIYRTIILSFVLYGCETWSLTLRKERRLRIFENKALRRIFGPAVEKTTYCVA
jgi:hypothetical protein